MGIFRQFPYSNFHEMNMDEILKILKTMQEEWNATKTEWASYKDFIDNYFANLDVSEEVLAAIRTMAASGELNPLIDPTIASETAAWLVEHITQPTDPVVDTSLSIAGAAADAKVTGDDLRILNGIVTSIKNDEVITVDSVFTAGKGINSSGVLFNSATRIATENYIDIRKAKALTYNITDGYRLFVAYYSDTNESAYRSTQGWLTGSGHLTINGDYMRVCYASIGDAETLTPADADKITLTYEYNNYYALKFKSVLVTDIDDMFDPGIYRVPTNPPAANRPDDFSGGLLIVSNSLNAISSLANTYQKTQILVDPTNGSIFIRYASSGNVWREWYQIKRNAPVVETTKWLAVGDSITYGVYSYIDEHGDPQSSSTVNCWINFLAKALNYELTRMASRGMGYSAEVTGQDPDDPDGPRISINDLLTRIEALSDDFNLITIAFGINDYATVTTTDATITTGLESCLSRIIAKFPKARVVVFTPFNTCRYGTSSTNYDFNQSHGGKTLKHVADLIQTICYNYGVECVYATNGFLFNNFNIEELEPDHTHPSAMGHRLIAKSMVHILNY